MRDEGNRRIYILSPAYCLRGWKLLPFGITQARGTNTEFVDKETYALMLDCDGETLIDYDALSEKQKAWYDFWEEQNVIQRCTEKKHLLPYQEYKAYDCRYKSSISWSITGKCNYSCRHCFMSAPHALTGEPSYEQLMTMLDSFERCGIRGIGLTGGEPLIRPDFWQLVDEIRKRDMFITTIYSNGKLVDDRFIEELEKRDLHPVVQLSFDGVGHHDWMRGVKGAEQIAVDAFRRCQKHGIRTSASMALCRESAPSIRETVKLLASVGCSSFKINNASPQGEWKNEPEHYLTDAEANQIYLDYIPYFFEDGAPLSLVLEGLFHYNTEEKVEQGMYEKWIPEANFADAPMCAVVRRSMYVSPEGNVLPCMSLVATPIEKEFPNLLTQPLEEILDDPSHYMSVINFRIQDFMDHNPECRECEYREACCGGCRATALITSPDDYLAKDMKACEYFKGGWKKRKEDILRAIGREDLIVKRTSVKYTENNENRQKGL